MVTNTITGNTAPNGSGRTDFSSMNTMEYDADGIKITLKPEYVRDFLVSGKNRDAVTMQDIVFFMNLCKANGLNPFIHDAYMIKYTREDPASMIISVQAYLKRAESYESYDGFHAGVIVKSETGGIEEREGAFVIPGERLLGGWATVFRKDRKKNDTVRVSLSEYAKQSVWNEKPSTMIRKVALVSALRETFPESCRGAAIADENNMIISDARPAEIETAEQPKQLAENVSSKISSNIFHSKAAEPIPEPVSEMPEGDSLL